MKYTYVHYLSILIFIGISCRSEAQTVKLYTADGDSITNRIIDINSSLTVKVQKNELLPYLVKYAKDPVSDQLLNEIHTLNAVLKNQVQIQESLSAEIQPGHEMEVLANYSKYIVEFYQAILSDPETEKLADDIMSEYYRLKGEGKIDLEVFPQSELYLIHKLTELSQTRKSKIQQLESISGIKIKLLAFLSNKQGKNRVHIENFDNISNDEFYEVERWVTNFSEEDKTTFENTKSLATKLNTLISTNGENLTQNVLASIKSLQCFKVLLDTLNSVVRDKEMIISQNREFVNQNLDSGLAEMETLFVDMKNLTGSFESYSDNEILFYNSIINQATNKMTQTLSSFKERLHNFPAALRNNNSRIAGLVTMADECTEIFQRDVTSISNLVSWISGMFKPFKDISDNSEELSESALEFSIDNLPESGFIEMVSSGKRENGDELQIKTVFKKPDSDDEPGNDEVVEINKFKLYQTGFYSTTKISLILAHPYNIPELDQGENFLETKFQFAPAASLLFKYGSKRSVTYNDFWNIGFGINFSSPDFNLDGQPEFGAGLIVTTLKDYVSAGWSYNFGQDVPFVFIGLTIPVGIPGPVNTVQSE